MVSGTLGATAQSSNWSNFKRLSRPEKCWVITHPFVAKKAWKISQQVQSIVDEAKADSVLDGDGNGGQLDAFRHAYWMAMLSQEMHWRKAWKLGKAHERGNKLQFKQGKLEDGATPDAAATEMDLFNNRVGLEVGWQVRKAIKREELAVFGVEYHLESRIIEQVRAGNLRVISKSSNGQPLDAAGDIIPQHLLTTWKTPRCLVPSSK